MKNVAGCRVALIHFACPVGIAEAVERARHSRSAAVLQGESKISTCRSSHESLVLQLWQISNGDCRKTSWLACRSLAPWEQREGLEERALVERVEEESSSAEENLDHNLRKGLATGERLCWCEKTCERVQERFHARTQREHCPCWELVCGGLNEA
ncbi:uncharacterized protein [Physcomitrium patens]|uniref:uncharacterized protein n=1 Tax=Physcomitrium patens TaxID=3218 RepID=UPI003CCD4832